MLAAVVLAGGGACYTSPINMAPTISDIQPPRDVYRNEDLTFTVIASDPDNDLSDMDIQWTHNVGPCGLPGATRERGHTTYVVPKADTDGTFCVWAMVQDRYQAAARRSLEVHPLDRDPVATLSITGRESVSPFSLFRELRFDAFNLSDPDGDLITMDWSIRPDPRGDVISLNENTCTDDPSEISRCWTPEVAGMYVVDLSLDDNHGPAVLKSQPFQVADDAVPCLTGTMPSEPTLVRLTDVDVQVAVTEVDDDGDPYQGDPDNSTATFTWFVRVDAGEMVRQGTIGPSYRINRGSYSVGQTVRVRVEVADRNPLRSQTLLATCGDSDVCAVRPGCVQRTTWTVKYDQ